jgi:hypothetical protein
MRVRRLEVVDEYVEDGRAAVYTSQGMVLLLSELATSVWTALGDDWVPSNEVAEALVREFGNPAEGDADRLTEEALRQLAEMALVELDETAVPDDAARA